MVRWSSEERYACDADLCKLTEVSKTFFLRPTLGLAVLEVLLLFPPLLGSLGCFNIFKIQIV